MTGSALYFVEPGEVRVEETDVPDPAGDELLVETGVTAVSRGTELLVYSGDVPEHLDVDETIEALDGGFDYPLQYGYAAVGEVVAQGREVEGDWRGRTVCAFNPHESHFTARPGQVFPVPTDVSDEAASLLPTAETATTLAMDGRPVVGERAVVFGAGAVGLVTTRVLSEFPLAELTVVEPVPERREIAAAMGADETLPPARAGTLGERGQPPGADLVYELSGDPDALDDAIAAAGYDGRIVVGSWYGRKRADVDLGGFFHRGRIDLVSSQVSTIAPEHRGRWTTERRMEVAWENLRRVDVDRLVTHRVPFESAPEAYRALEESPGDALQVLLLFD